MGLSDRVLTAAERKPFDKAPAQWLAASAMKADTTLRDNLGLKVPRRGQLS